MEIKKFSFENNSFDEIIKLFSMGLGDTNEELWRWKYATDNGFGSSVMYVITEQEQIVAMMGFLPMQYTDQYGNMIKTIQSCDLVVKPEYRGQGFFYKIYTYAEEELKKDGFSFYIAFPNENSLHGFSKMNYKAMKMKSYLPASNLLHMLMKKIGVNAREKNSLKYSIHLNDHIETLADVISGDKGQWLTDHYITIDLNKEFLKWKSSGPNLSRYKYISVYKDEKLVAYFIIMITRGNHFAASKIVNFNILNEYIFDVKTIGKLVKAKIYSFCDLIDFYGLWGIEIQKLIVKAFGAGKMKSNAGNFIYKSFDHFNENDILINHFDSDL